MLLSVTQINTITQVPQRAASHVWKTARACCRDMGGSGEDVRAQMLDRRRVQLHAAAQSSSQLRWQCRHARMTKAKRITKL